MPSPRSPAHAVIVRPLSFPWQTRDPFIFCAYHEDHYPPGNAQLGPAASLKGRHLGQDFAGIDGWRMYHGLTVPGFPQHPHRGFETVSILRRGVVDHTDSLGATARFAAGDVQWLTAGGGIQHAEMFPLLDTNKPNPLQMLQIWLNLPRTHKLATPRFAILWSDTIPEVRVPDDTGRVTNVRLVAGSYQNTPIGDVNPPAPPPDSWAAQGEANVTIWLITMEPQGRWSLPPAAAGALRTLYTIGGAVHLDGQPVPTSHLAEIQREGPVEVTNQDTEADLLLLQGKPIAEPVVQAGPFVMNSEREIREAFAAYHQSQFGGWPWTHSAPVHPRDTGRFARHADGHIERPRDGL